MKQNIDSVNYCNDELDIYTYMLILWKRKKYLVLLFCLSTTITLIVLLSLPTIYKGKIVLKPGIKDITPEGVEVFIESPEKIINNINTGFFNPDIDIEKFKINSEINLTTIIVNISSTDKLVLQSVGKEFIDQLIKYYSPLIEEQKGTIKHNIDKLFEDIKKNNENKTEVINNMYDNIDMTKSKIKRDKNKIEIIDKNINSLEANIAIAREIIKNIEPKINSNMNIDKDLYDIYQKNMLRIDTIATQLKSDKLMIEDIAFEIIKNGVDIEKQNNIIPDIQDDIKTTEIAINKLINNNYTDIDKHLLTKNTTYNNIIVLQNVFKKLSAINIIRNNTSNPVKTEYSLSLLVKIFSIVGIASIIIGSMIILFIEYTIEQKKTCEKLK